MELEKKDNIFTMWFLWRFYEMPRFLFSVWKNYLNFGSNYFSIPLLFKTFFSPWRKYNWRYPKNFNIVEFFNTLISNIFSRIIGAFLRVVLIALGIVFQFFIFTAGIIVILFWIFIPLIIISGFLFIFFA